MEKMSERDERRIMTALERVVGMTNGGTDPNDALSKVASDERFSQPIVQRMVEAYNVSKQLSHLKSAAGPERAGSFPLADASRVLGHMYPEQVKTASAKAADVYTPDEYKRPEQTNFNKVAYERLPLPEQKKPEAYASDPLIRAHKAFGKDAGFVKRADEARRESRILFYKTLELAKQASEYFRMVGATPFAEVEKKVWKEYGQIGKSAMDLLYEFSNRHEKRAEAAPTHQVMLDIRQEPYKSIHALVKTAHDFHAANDTAVEAELSLAEYRKTSGTEPPKTAAAEDLSCNDVLGTGRPFDSGAGVAAAGATEKAAFMAGLQSTLGDLGSAGMSAVGLSPGDPDASRRKALASVIDPVHEAKMQAIKTKSILNDFLSNDPILSAHDPKDVMQAYNHIAELAPSVSQQPSVMRGLLRRMIQQEGVMEPHEAEQISSIEKQLRGTQYQPLFGGKDLASS